RRKRRHETGVLRALAALPLNEPLTLAPTGEVTASASASRTVRVGEMGGRGGRLAGRAMERLYRVRIACPVAYVSRMGEELENDMMLRWGLLLLWGQLLVGCATTRLVQLDMGEGAPIVHTPRSDAQQVELDKGEFAEGVVALARDVRPSAHPLQDARRLWGVP